MGDAQRKRGFYEATLATKNAERVRPTDDTSGKSNGVAGEFEGAIINVGSGREEGDEQMLADVQEAEHVAPSAVAGEETDRDHEDLLGDEEAPTRNVRNPNDHPRKESYTASEDTYHTGLGVQSV